MPTASRAQTFFRHACGSGRADDHLRSAAGDFTVRLGTAPEASVTVAVESDDTGAATVSDSSLTFTTTDWDTPQTVTVSGVSDADSDDESVTVSLSATSTDANYQGLTASVAVTVEEGGTDPSLSDLTLVDGNNNTVTLDPEFDTATTSYTASVANSVMEITVTPTTTEARSTVQYLDSDDNAIPDADTVAGGQQVALEPGENTIKVSVTAEDSVTTETYTVVVSRAYRILVSNLGKSTDVWYVVGGSDNSRVAQKFTVDSDSDYSLRSVTINVPRQSSAGIGTALHTGTTDPSATALYALTAPGGSANGDRVYTAPANARLEAGESYFVLVTGPPSNTRQVSQTNSTDEDTSGISGWSIADNSLAASSGSWNSRNQALKIQLRGVAIPSNDATLSDLAITDDASNSVALSPAFAAGTTGYTASVSSATQEITVTPETSNDGASVQFLNAGDNAITDADTIADGMQVALVEGSNTIKVKVTAEDGLVMETYTVMVTRARPGALIVNPTTISLREDSSGDFEVELATQPSANVTVAVTSGDTGAATVSDSSLDFTSTTWSTPQTVTVSGVDDSDEDNESLTVSLRSSSTDTEYQGKTGSVTVSVADDDSPEPFCRPRNLEGTVQGGSIVLTWDAPTDCSPTSYTVHRSLKNSNGAVISYMTDVYDTATSTTYTDTGVRVNHSHTYRVRSSGEVTWSERTDAIVYRGQSQPPVVVDRSHCPPSPRTATVTKRGDDSFSLSWGSIDFTGCGEHRPDHRGYSVWAQVDGSGSWLLLVETTGRSLTLDDRDRYPGSTTKPQGVYLFWRARQSGQGYVFRVDGWYRNDGGTGSNYYSSPDKSIKTDSLTFERTRQMPPTYPELDVERVPEVGTQPVEKQIMSWGRPGEFEKNKTQFQVKWRSPGDSASGMAVVYNDEDRSNNAYICYGRGQSGAGAADWVSRLCPLTWIEADYVNLDPNTFTQRSPIWPQGEDPDARSGSAEEGGIVLTARTQGFSAQVRACSESLGCSPWMNMVRE